MERFARNELLGDLPFEFDSMGAVLGHGFHPLKARQARSIPNLRSVHRQGRTPYVEMAKRLHQGSRYYADAAAFAKRLEKDVEDKRLLLQRLGLPK